MVFPGAIGRNPKLEKLTALCVAITGRLERWLTTKVAKGSCLRVLENEADANHPCLQEPISVSSFLQGQ